MLITNTSLMESIGEIKEQLNSLTSKIMKSDVGLKRKSFASSSVSSDKTLMDLASKLLEGPEFRDKVIELIQEHARENEASGDDSTERLLKPVLTEVSLANKSTAPKRPTTIRDETYVEQQSDQEENEPVELIDEAETSLANDLGLF